MSEEYSLSEVGRRTAKRSCRKSAKGHTVEDRDHETRGAEQYER